MSTENEDLDSLFGINAAIPEDQLETSGQFMNISRENPPVNARKENAPVAERPNTDLMTEEEKQECRLDQIEWGYKHNESKLMAGELLEPEEELSPEEKLRAVLDSARCKSLEDCPVPCAFVTGNAGTGKTYTIKKLIAEDEEFGVLAATTGIAAVNLGATTINSLLQYWNTESLLDRMASGRLTSLLHKLGHQVDNIIIDEISMMEHRQLAAIYRAIAEVNEYSSMQDKGRRLGLILTGDFCQLPPIPDRPKTGRRHEKAPVPWCFESEIWSEFAKRVVRLTKVWRQENPAYLTALNYLREGKGPEATEILKSLVKWRAAVDRDFDGTTIVAINDEVQRHNDMALDKLPGESIFFPSKSWGTLDSEGEGRDKGEWKNIPRKLRLKVGAYVMCIANSGAREFGQQMLYANGDCGHVTDIDIASKTVGVKLVRNGVTVRVPQVTRRVEVKDQPDTLWDKEMDQWDGKTPYYDSEKNRYIVGGITFVPLRAAYASTVHKSQGLTLDRIQVDSRAAFFGNPGMAYVALSRCKTPEGVVIVGIPSLFASKVKIDEKVRQWL